MVTEVSSKSSSSDSHQNVTSSYVPRQRFVYKPRRLRFPREETADEKPINTRTTAKSMDKEEAKPQEHASTGSEHAAAGGGGDNFPITLVEPYQSEQPDSSTAQQVESTQKISLRKSIDSDPGDFVKIETADNGGSDAAAVEVKPATPPVVVSSTSVEEKKEVEVPKSEQKKEEKVEQPAQKVEEKPKPKPEEKAEKKAEAKPGDKSPAASLLTWIHENPGMVRCCAATAAVVGVAGIGCFVYARRIRSGGV
ncbi:hypothetical protein Aduo_017063 [Ancylostoma duodenale]